MKYRTINRSSNVFSPVDILNPDYEKFPLFGEAVPLRCRIERGEFLFLPSGWWHEVQSYPEKNESINIALSFWFEPLYKKKDLCQTCPLEFNPFYRHLLWLKFCKSTLLRHRELTLVISTVLTIHLWTVTIIKSPTKLCYQHHYGLFLRKTPRNC